MLARFPFPEKRSAESSTRPNVCNKFLRFISGRRRPPGLPPTTPRPRPRPPFPTEAPKRRPDGRHPPFHPVFSPCGLPGCTNFSPATKPFGAGLGPSPILTGAGPTRVAVNETKSFASRAHLHLVSRSPGRRTSRSNPRIPGILNLLHTESFRCESPSGNAHARRSSVGSLDNGRGDRHIGLVLCKTLIRVTVRFFSGVLHPHLLGVCCPNRFFSRARISPLTWRRNSFYREFPPCGGVAQLV
jgi:hypothetical protein